MRWFVFHIACVAYDKKNYLLKTRAGSKHLLKRSKNGRTMIPRLPYQTSRRRQRPAFRKN